MGSSGQVRSLYLGTASPGEVDGGGEEDGASSSSCSSSSGSAANAHHEGPEDTALSGRSISLQERPASKSFGPAAAGGGGGGRERRGERWLAFVKDQLKAGAQEREHELQPLCRVPAMQRNANPQAYAPCLFSFGPYHASFPSAGDHFKLQAARAMDPDKFQSLVDDIHHRYDDVRKFYAEPWGEYPCHFDLDAETLSYLLALDAITILVAATEASLRVFQPFCVRSIICRDAILLENQLPFFVLRMAFLRSIGPGALMDGRMEDLVRFYATESRDCPFSEADWLWRPNAGQSMLEGHSLLSYIYEGWTGEAPDLSSTGADWRRKPNGRQRMWEKQSVLSYIYEGWTGEAPDLSVPTFESVSQELERGISKSNIGLVEESIVIGTVDESCPIRSASHLYRCGIKFRPSEGSGFTGIQFDARTRTIFLPKIRVGDGTQRYLLNLIAYEFTCKYWSSSLVMSYAFVMDFLIDSEDDVRVLVESGVIDSLLGSHEKLAAMWNELCVGLPHHHMSTSHKRVIRAVNKAIKARMPRWIYGFKETYLERKPWLFGSIVLAVVLLTLTLLQTIYTMKSAL